MTSRLAWGCRASDDEGDAAYVSERLRVTAADSGRMFSQARLLGMKR